MNAHLRLCCENERANIERSSLCRGNPILIDAHKLFNRLYGKSLIDCRDAKTLIRAIQAGHVAVRAEEKDASILRAVSLQALKNLLAIMQAHRGGIKLDWTIGNDARIVPALALVIVHQEHMIGIVISEA